MTQRPYGHLERAYGRFAVQYDEGFGDVAPITPMIVSPHGGYLYARTSPSEGSCATHSYPCYHPGLDVVGRAGTPVVAPEDGIVHTTAPGSGPPFTGYGPWVVIIQGKSGRFHLLAHLDPDKRGMAPTGTRVSAGQQVGVTSSANHVHWEVRKKPVPDFGKGESNRTNNLDPVAWLKGASLSGVAIVLAAAGAAAAYLVARRR